MTDSGQGARSASTGCAAEGTPTGGTGGPATARDVADLAQQLGFGAARGTHALGGGAGCWSPLLATVLLGPGIGLVAGPDGPATTSLGAALLAVAVAVVPLTLRHARHHRDRVPRLHLFDGGGVLTQASEITAFPWGDIRLIEYAHSASTAQGSGTQTFQRLRLDHADGRTLCSVNADFPGAGIAHIALASGAHADEQTTRRAREAGRRDRHKSR